MAENNGKHTTINPEGKTTLTIVAILFFVINLPLFLIPAIMGWWSYAALGLTLLFVLFFLNFFRNPVRRFPSDDQEKVVVVPADGTVVAIEEVDETDYFNDRRLMVSIFMSVWSVHANWFPVNGKVIKSEHQDGNFHAAFKPKASTENERSLVVIKTPDDKEIIKGSPERRRNFIDMAASQLNPLFVARLNRHAAIMNQRNAMLKQLMQKRGDRSILEVWDRQAAQEGAVISWMRHEYISLINGICSELYRTISGGEEELTLEYRSAVYRSEDFEKPCGPEMYDMYFDKLRETEEYDIRTGTTHSGVNRDEIVIRINGLSARDFGSQGQIKSAALVMKLAQAVICMKRTKDAPVVFLDDVMGELDEERQLRTAAIKAGYEHQRETWTNHIRQLNLNYEKKERELREQLMATYKTNREKAEAERAAQEGGAQ